MLWHMKRYKQLTYDSKDVFIWERTRAQGHKITKASVTPALLLRLSPSIQPPFSKSLFCPVSFLKILYCSHRPPLLSSILSAFAACPLLFTFLCAAPVWCLPPDLLLPWVSSLNLPESKKDRRADINPPGPEFLIELGGGGEDVRTVVRWASEGCI